MKNRALLALPLALAFNLAHADAYIGGVLGSAHTDISCSAASSCDGNDTGVKAYVGFPLALRGVPNLSLEVGYIDFGQAKESVLGQTVGTTTVSAVTGAAAMHATLTPTVQLVGRLGVAYVNGKLERPVLGSRSDSQLALYGGAGLSFALNRQLKLVADADFTSYDTGNASGSVRLLGVGLQYAF
jgi:hypothetical protein